MSWEGYQGSLADALHGVTHTDVDTALLVLLLLLLLSHSRMQIPVTCNGTRGIFSLPEMRINCLCESCEEVAAAKRIFTPTQFEQHGGCGTAKKWRISIRWVLVVVRESVRV